MSRIYFFIFGFHRYHWILIDFSHLFWYTEHADIWSAVG